MAWTRTRNSRSGRRYSTRRSGGTRSRYSEKQVALAILGVIVVIIIIVYASHH